MLSLETGGCLNIKITSRDRLIFNMGIPILGEDGLYIETGLGVLSIEYHRMLA